MMPSTSTSLRCSYPKQDVPRQPGNSIINYAIEFLTARFWSRVGEPDENGCMNWLRGKTPFGYGEFSTCYKTFHAHRIAWEFSHGPIPTGQLVCHKCDNPSCCNIEHLFLGTHRDNSRDKMKKGRDNWARGEASGNNKLNEAQVIEIRLRHADGELGRRLAEEFGIGTGAISKIVNRQRWRHLS